MSHRNAAEARAAAQALSPRDLFIRMVTDSLRSMTFTTSCCWQQTALVDIQDSTRFPAQQQQQLLRIVRRGMEHHRQVMTMYDLLSHCMEAAMEMFMDSDAAAVLIPPLVSAFMWTAIDGHSPWAGFTVVAC